MADSTANLEKARQVSGLEYRRDVTGDSVEDALGDAAGNPVAKAFSLPDFYSIHLLNFCQGDYRSKPAADDASQAVQASREVTSCSKLNISGTVDLRAMLEEQMNGISKHLNSAWPSEIDHGMAALHDAQDAMHALFISALVSMTLSLLATLGTAIFPWSNFGTFAATFLNLLSASTLGLANGFLTLVIFQTFGLIKSWGSDVGVEAIRGNKLVILAWSAWLAITGATAVTLALSRRRRRLGY